MTDEVRQEDREAAVFRKRGSVEAIRWFKLGDHPAVIRRERWPEPRDTHWTYWLGPLTGGFPVEVGDWIITDQSGRHSRKSPEDFDRAYELDDAAPLRTRIAELEAENARLREALSPFVDLRYQPEGGKVILKALRNMAPINVTVTKAQMKVAAALIYSPTLNGEKVDG